MKIGLLVYPNCMFSGLFAFSELLTASNLRANRNHFTFQWVATDLAPIQLPVGNSSLKTTITPDTTLLNSQFDALLIPGFWASSIDHFAQIIEQNYFLVDSLAQLDEKIAIWSYCLSVGFIAKSGKLKEKEATATWWLADYLQTHFQNVHWRFSKTLILDGIHVTASGVNGYLPIAQELIQNAYGEAILREVTDLMVLPRPETDIQPFQNLNIMNLDDKLAREIVRWVERTPAVDLSVSNLANELHFSERTLARKIKLATGLSSAKFMRFIKLRQAGELLMYGTESVDHVSSSLGYSDGASFRRAFKQVTSYTPMEYRRAFSR